MAIYLIALSKSRFMHSLIRILTYIGYAEVLIWSNNIARSGLLITHAHLIQIT